MSIIFQVLKSTSIWNIVRDEKIFITECYRLQYQSTTHLLVVQYVIVFVFNVQIDQKFS